MLSFIYLVNESPTYNTSLAQHGIGRECIPTWVAKVFPIGGSRHWLIYGKKGWSNKTPAFRLETFPCPCLIRKSCSFHPIVYLLMVLLLFFEFFLNFYDNKLTFFLNYIIWMFLVLWCNCKWIRSFHLTRCILIWGVVIRYMFHPSAKA